VGWELKPFRTGGHGRYPKHLFRGSQPPYGNMCCIQRTWLLTVSERLGGTAKQKENSYLMGSSFS
jgi:hypothetical protein